MTGTQPLARSRVRLALAAAFAALGLVCLGWVALVEVRARHFDRAARSALADARGRDLAGAASADSKSPPPILGILEIPRIQFSEVVAEGDDDLTLDVAIGHLPDTPLPWAPGNSALAGHRDRHFSPLSDIRPGDVMRLLTARGDLEYRVTETLIVDPQDTWVLASPTPRRLTLITCYPFIYVGNAPKRFIVWADAVDTAVP